MPAKFHQVPPTVWDRTMRELSGPATVVRLYVMTCNSRVSEGLFHLPVGIIVHDTGLSIDQVTGALDELAGAGLVLYDAAGEVVLDCTALRYQPLRHGRDDDGTIRRNRAMPNAVKLVGQVPDTPLKRTLFALARDHAPDFAYELGENYPILTTPDPPSMGDGRGIEPKGDRRGIEGGSRDEASRGEVSRGEGPACHWCEQPALVTAGVAQVALDDHDTEQPYCGWCREAGAA